MEDDELHMRGVGILGRRFELEKFLLFSAEASSYVRGKLMWTAVHICAGFCTHFLGSNSDGLNVNHLCLCASSTVQLSNSPRSIIIVTLELSTVCRSNIIITSRIKGRFAKASLKTDVLLNTVKIEFLLFHLRPSA